MPLVTLFTAPKAFTDPDTARSQRNAIGSWVRLDDVDILLLGDEPGLEAAARDLGVRHIPSVSKNPSGVPLISSMFNVARANSESRLLAIVNTDIVLTSDFVLAARALDAMSTSSQLYSGFLLVSRRWDLGVPQALDFGNGWENILRSEVHKHGELHRPAGSDLFLFPRACYPEIPDFTIGRAGWDNWMIYKAHQEGWSVVDGTPSMLIVHQSHDYRHLPGAQPHYNHPDTTVNTRLAGGQATIRYTILDATLELNKGRLVRPRLTMPRFLRRLELFLRRVLFFLPDSTVESIARPQRWRKRISRLLGGRRL